MTTSNEHNNAPAVPSGLLQKLDASIAWLERGEVLPGTPACIGLDDIKVIRALLTATPTPAPAQEVASAFTTALDIRLAQGWNLTGNAIPVLYTDTINDYQVRRDDVWLCTTDALKTKHDVVTDDWSECKRISELPEVDEALRLFAEGETSEDQAVAIVQSVAQALRAKGQS